MTGPTAQATTDRVTTRLAARWAGLDVAWRRAIGVALVLRVGVALVTLLAPRLLAAGPSVPVDPAPGFAGWTAVPASGLGLVGAGLERFDALWYLAIAADGYPATDVVPQAAAFFPGLPTAIALVGALLGGRLLLAANLVALAATVAALAGVHELARWFATRRALPPREVDDLARRAVVLLAAFPTAFFLVAPYSEAPFLATTAWALVLATRGRWGWAGVLGLAAGTLRPLGAVLALPLLLLSAPGDRRRALTAAAGPVLGLAAVAGAAWARYGSPTAVLEVQQAWQREPLWPWETLRRAVTFALDGLADLGPGTYQTLDLVVFLPVVAAVAWLLRADRALGLYALAHVAVWFLAPFPGRPLLSTPRFAVAIAPLPLALAAWTRHRGAEASALAISIALQVVHLALFTTWGYVF